MYRPTYFILEEVLPMDYYLTNEHREDRLWLLFDERVLVTADRLRARFGKMNCNTWTWNGSYNYRGYRPPDCTVGAELSQHKFGRALDLVPLEVTSEEIRQEIIATPNEAIYQHITAIELGITWLHFDIRNRDKAKNGLLTFNP